MSPTADAGIFFLIVRDKTIIDFLNSGIKGGLSSNGFSRFAFSSKFVTYFSEYVTKVNDFLDLIGCGKFLKNHKEWSEIEKQVVKSKLKLFYLDHNNLYGSAQMMKLPKFKFTWGTGLQKRAIGICLKTLKLEFKGKTFKEENSSLENILNETIKVFFC